LLFFGRTTIWLGYCFCSKRTNLYSSLMSALPLKIWTLGRITCRHCWLVNFIEALARIWASEQSKSKRYRTPLLLVVLVVTPWASTWRIVSPFNQLVIVCHWIRLKSDTWPIQKLPQYWGCENDGNKWGTKQLKRRRFNLLNKKRFIGFSTGWLAELATVPFSSWDLKIGWLNLFFTRIRWKTNPSDWGNVYSGLEFIIFTHRLLLKFIFKARQISILTAASLSITYSSSVTLSLQVY